VLKQGQPAVQLRIRPCRQQLIFSCPRRGDRAGPSRLRNLRSTVLGNSQAKRVTRVEAFGVL
jgi:hypothetical protein